MAAPAEKVVAEEVKELEKDAKKDPSPKIVAKPAFLTPDTTLNCLPSTVGNMLVSMGEGGLSNLVAGARANIGINSGRYMFEAKIVEKTGSKSMARFGFSAEGSLFLGEDDNSICFDNEGQLVSNKKKTKCSQPFGSDVLVSVVLNRDASSSNKDTISFFKNGVRASQPQPLPDSLKGKTLYPAVSFKNATVHLNFAAPAVPLPFTCKVISEASQKDAAVTKYDEPADGKFTALFPVSLPDEGTFQWVDSFLEKNPSYTELSDRAFVDWAHKSGLSGGGSNDCNDKPKIGGDMNLGSIKKALMQVAALQPRDFVIMEVKGNLIKEERAVTLKKFQGPSFRTVAEVFVGEPASAFKRRVQAKMVEKNQQASDRVFKAKKAGERREWAARKKTKEVEKLKKKNEKIRLKRVAEAKKKGEAHVKKRSHDLAVIAAKKAGKPEPEAPEEEKEEEAVESEEEAEEPEEPEPMEEEPPKAAALTAEEKATKFFKDSLPDLTPYVLNTTFTKFTLPEAEEGFDSVKYSWNKDKEAATYMQEWVSAKKQTTRVEDISAGADFKKAFAEWQKTLSAWKGKQNDYKAQVAKKLLAKNAKIAKKANAEKMAKINEIKKAKEAEAAKAAGKEVEEKEEAPAPVESEEEEEEEPQVDFDGIDVFGVDDILDIGGGLPLFKDFQFEDFAMMSLRYELNLLCQNFGKDCKDPDRTGIHLDHVAFYYQKYFGKPLTAQAFGVQTMAELVAMVDDTVSVTAQSVIESIIPGDLETAAVYIKLTEDARRTRIINIDMGVEGAKLKIRAGGDNNHGEKRNFGGDGGGAWKKPWSGGGGGGGNWGGNKW